MRNEQVVIKAGGIAAVLAAVLYIFMFSFLMANFNYPEILLQDASVVLPSLLAMGHTGRLALAVYCLLPLLFIPLGVATYFALRQNSEATMTLAKTSIIVASIAIMLGLMRWPSIQWQLAELYISADANQREIISSVFDGINIYLGNYLSEFVGELCLSLFFVLTGFGILKQAGIAKWTGYFSIFTGIMLYVAIFRNVAWIAKMVSEISYVSMILPVTLIVLGIGLLRYRSQHSDKMTHTIQAQQEQAQQPDSVPQDQPQPLQEDVQLERQAQESPKGMSQIEMEEEIFQEIQELGDDSNRGENDKNSPMEYERHDSYDTHTDKKELLK